MEEEKGGYLHILFIFIGIAMLCSGLFYYFTDDHIELNPELNKNEETKPPVEDKDLLEVINISKKDNEIIFKNGKKAIIYLNNDEENSSIMFNDNKVIDVNSISCDKAFLYNNSVIIYCFKSIDNFGEIYSLNSDGKVKKYDDFLDNGAIVYPNSILLEDNKLIVTGSKMKDEGIIEIENDKVNICNINMNDDEINVNLPIESNYELVNNEDNLNFIFEKSSLTIEKYYKENCKKVE